MTYEEFYQLIGQAPENDDLERINCNQAGDYGHFFCGLCHHGYPKFMPCERCYPPIKGSVRNGTQRFIETP